MHVMTLSSVGVEAWLNDVIYETGKLRKTALLSKGKTDDEEHVRVYLVHHTESSF